MDYLILSLVGGVLLFGIFYLLPFKMTAWQKMLYVMIALIFANLFLFIHSLLGLWKSAIILVLLVFLVSYFITKSNIVRHTDSNKKVFENGDEQSITEMQVTDGSLPPRTQSSRKKAKVDEIPIQKHDEIRDMNDQETIPEHIEEIEIKTIEEGNKGVESEVQAISEIEVIDEIILQDKDKTPSFESNTTANSEWNEDEEVFLNRQVSATIEEQVEEHLKEVTTDTENSFSRENIFAELDETAEIDGEEGAAENISPLQQLFDVESISDEATSESEEETFHTELLETVGELDEIPYLEETEVLERKLEELDDFGDLPVLEEIKVETDKSINISSLQEEKAVEKLTEQDHSIDHLAQEMETVQDQLEEMELPLVEELENCTELIENEEVNVADEGLDVSKRSVVITNMEDEAIVAPESNVRAELTEAFTEHPEIIRKPKMNRDMRDLFIEQLNWMKGNVSVANYEDALMQYIQEDLDDQDYYIFTSMLRDHYLETEQFVKLEQLIMKLKDRFSSKTIILEELAFFEKNFL